MEQVQSVYEDFIGRYQISKTLRFKLNPVGKTQEWIDKNNIVDHDEQKMKDSKRVKEIIDDIHRKFIEDVLTSVKIDG